jgi:quercetin dioxygenase-like cupin family protein
VDRLGRQPADKTVGALAAISDDNMEIVNAISKVRFNSARPRRIQLTRGGAAGCDLLCIEPGQEVSASGPCTYYIIAGEGQLSNGSPTETVRMGQLVSCGDGERHALSNTSEQRLICLSMV